MATVSTQKLVTSFTGADGKSVSYSFSDSLGPSEIDVDDVNALMDAMITNKDQFVKQPSSKKSASIVTTSTTELDLSAAS